MTSIHHSTESFRSGHFGLVWTETEHYLVIGWSRDPVLLTGDRLVAAGTYDAVQAARRLLGDEYV